MNHFVYTISKENIEMMDKEEKEIYFNILNKINKLNDKWNTKNLILNQYKLSLCIYIIIMLFVILFSVYGSHSPLYNVSLTITQFILWFLTYKLNIKMRKIRCFQDDMNNSFWKIMDENNRLFYNIKSKYMQYRFHN
jgi:hypothetical protein